jgi:RNA polymerase sigma-70 factor (ECF subfamily)
MDHPARENLCPEDLDVLIRNSQAGSGEAFTQIVRLHQARVRTYLSRYVKDRNQVDDLAQEVFLAAYRSLRTFKGHSLFSTWLLGIARNRALHHLREHSRRRDPATVPLDSVLAACILERAQGESSDPSLHESRLEALERCLKRLAGRSLAVISGFYSKQRKCSEIAREMNTTEGVVWMALVRTRQALRECIERRLTSPEANP